MKPSIFGFSVCGFIGALDAETLKLRRTPVLLLLLVAPYVVTLFFALFAYFDGDRFLTEARAWSWLVDSSFTFWCMIAMPMWCAIVTAQVAAIEHRSQGFKQLFVLPVGRATLYFAKQSLCWLLAGAVLCGEALAIVVAGLLLRWTRPGLGFEANVPLARLTLFVGLTLAASLFFVALQTWLALERSDAAIPIAVGFLAIVSALALKSLNTSLDVYHPWAYPSMVVDALVSNKVDWLMALVGGAGGGIFTAMAAWNFARRDVH